MRSIVKDWITTAKHPTTGKRFVDMTYQPMLEVLAYLRANGFKNFIVSGGGIEFMRPWTEAAYGIPPEQVVGSSMKTKFELRDGKAVLVRLPALNFNDDKADKPVGINQHIGRRPIAAFGNSVGDQQMLEYTHSGSGARFELLVLHDDAAREFAYGPARGLPDVKYGFFTPALEDHAKKDGWTVVSMKDDWKTVFPAAPSAVTAIDILLEPDATMLGHSADNNARLLKVHPAGFSLDEAHTPHITMLQCFARTADLDQLYAAAGKVLAGANVTAMKLEAFKYYYAPAGAKGVAGICAKPTPEILKLQADIIAAVKPFLAETGPIGAFTAPHANPAIDAAIIQYVSTFVPKMSRRELQSARQHRRRPQSLPRPDAGRAVQAVHVLARRRGCLPTRPVRHGGEEAQAMEFEIVTYHHETAYKHNLLASARVYAPTFVTTFFLVAVSTLSCEAAELDRTVIPLPEPK